MAITVITTAGPAPAFARASSTLARAALGLFVHSLLHFGRPCAIDRMTGRVRPL